MQERYKTLEGEPMKRVYILFLLSLFLILGSIYRLWDIHQPKAGPVGDGTIPKHIYVSIYTSLILGIIGVLNGINKLIQVKRKNKEYR